MKLVLKIIWKILKWSLIYLFSMLATGEVLRRLRWVEIDAENDMVGFGGPIGKLYQKVR